MANSDTFSLYIHYGGNFIELGADRLYAGGKMSGKHGLDPDKFGYLDVEDEVQKLGFVSWACLAYKVPQTMSYKVLQDDRDVMQMLSHLSKKCRVLSVYVDKGEKAGETSGDVGGDGEGEVNFLSRSSVMEEHLGGDGSVIEELVEIDVEGEVDEEDSEGWISEEDDEYMPSPKQLGVRKEKQKEKQHVGDEQIGVRKDKQKEKQHAGDEHIGVRREKRKGLVDELEKVDLTEEADGDYMSSTDESEDIMSEKELPSDDDREAGQSVVGQRNEDSEIVSDSGLNSDYDDSEGEVNSDSTGDEAEPKQKREKRITYDPKCDHKSLKLMVGMRFEDGLQCREALRTYSIENGYPIHFRRVSKHQCEAICTSPCTWRCYGSIIKRDGRFTIKVITGDHTCPREIHNKQATSDWICKKYLKEFRLKPNMTAKELEADIMNKYACRVSMWKCYSSIWKARDELGGSVLEHYAQLRPYIGELVKQDREGRFELLLSDDSIFRGLYVGFSALKKGFTMGCRPFIGLDGCFLKTHLGGILLSAIGRDGNNQMFPVAWAVVEVENESCWTWFLRILFEELGITDGLGFTIMSDQQKGLLNAVKNLAPYAEHRNCARHIYCNWKKQHKGATLKNIFWRICRSTYVEAYKAALEELKEENLKAYEDFLEREPQRFCKAFISTVSKCDSIDNNMSETFNHYIVSARSMNVIDMLQDIRCSLMKRHFKKFSDVASVNEDSVCPKIRSKIEALKFDNREGITHPSVGDKYEVKMQGQHYVVSLGNVNYCTCRVWNLTGIPCVHACSAITFLKLEPSNFVDACYKIPKYIEAYRHGLPPLNGPDMWPDVDGFPVKPPRIRRMPGRPKEKRKRDVDEISEASGSRLKRQVFMTCQRCLQPGHNTRSCKNEPAQKPEAMKGKRGRPRKQAPASASRPASAETSTSRAASTSRLMAYRARVASASRPTSTSRPVSTSKSAVIGKEMALANKGVGVLVCEGSGNIYCRMPTEKRAHFVNPPRRSSRQAAAKKGATGASGTRDQMPTQESHT